MDLYDANIEFHKAQEVEKRAFHEAQCQTSTVRSQTFEERLDEFFTYRSPSPEQQLRLTEVREAAKAFAHVLARHVPNGADRTTAIRKLREVTMTANAAIVLNGLNL